jgi:hypothetical protein
MGLYDEVKINFLFEEKYKHLQDLLFQTKSLFCGLDEYLIDETGQLWLQEATWETVPEEKRPYYNSPEWEKHLGKIIGSLEIKKEEPIKHSHTGEVRMHYYDKNVDCEIVCFFDDGKMLSFKVIEKETK